MIWTNTKTLDEYFEDRNDITEDKTKATVALLGSKTIDLNEFPNLNAMFRVGVSKDNLPYDQAQQRNVIIALPSRKVQRYIYEETANFTCSLIFKAFYENIGSTYTWEKNKDRTILNKKNLLVIGNGNIGNKVFEKMVHILNVYTFDIKDPRCTDEMLEKGIRQADVVSLHIPATDNENFFDKEKLSWMKDGSSLINTSRASIVNEYDLFHEIKSKRITAYFDVFWEEPYEGILSYREGFNMTPHVASICKDFLDGAWENFKKVVDEYV